jgi:hypothetical protein
MEPQLRALHVFDQEAVREKLAMRPDSERGYGGGRGEGCGFGCLTHARNLQGEHDCRYKRP